MSTPLEDAPLKKGKKFPFLRKDLVLKRALGKDSDRWGQQWCEGRARQDPMVRRWIECCRAKGRPMGAAALGLVVKRP